jgi:hypothetical protein
MKECKSTLNQDTCTPYVFKNMELALKPNKLLIDKEIVAYIHTGGL